MNGGYHVIERGQYFISIIQRSIAQNIGLYAFQNTEIVAVGGIERVDFAVLFGYLFGLEPLRVSGGLGVVGNAEIT